jgi:hypothetical protein
VRPGYPAALPSLIASSNSSPGMAAAMNAVYRILEIAGLDVAQRVRCGDVIFSLITGFVLLDINSGGPLSPMSADLTHLADVVEALADSTFPSSLDFAIAFRSAASRPRPRAGPDRGGTRSICSIGSTYPHPSSKHSRGYESNCASGPASRLPSGQWNHSMQVVRLLRTPCRLFDSFARGTADSLSQVDVLLVRPTAFTEADEDVLLEQLARLT